MPWQFDTDETSASYSRCIASCVPVPVPVPVRVRAACVSGCCEENSGAWVRVSDIEECKEKIDGAMASLTDVWSAYEIWSRVGQVADCLVVNGHIM